MNKFTKPYEVRKSIKFKLIPEIQSKPYFIPDYELELPELLGSYKELIENLINFFYSEKEVKEFSKMPRLKHTFLKENFKEDWYCYKRQIN